jgi:cobyric acid synthase CobQ/L-threonine-O-3-phosphate decarboxylase
VATPVIEKLPILVVRAILKTKSGLMEIFEHGGNIDKINRKPGFGENDLIDFSANINPLGLPDELKYSILQNLGEVVHYPDPNSNEFIAGVCERFGVKPENVIVGNGASELFFGLVRIIEKQRVVIVSPSYSDYERAALLEGRQIDRFDLTENDNFELRCDELAKKLTGDEIVMLGRPNNPTGTFVSKNELLLLIQTNPNTVFIIDEAFFDFVSFSEKEHLNLPGKHGESLCSTILPNLLVVVSLTKMYAVAGLRIGLAIGPQNLIAQAKSLQSSWPLNTFAQIAGSLIMKNQSLSHNYAQTTRKYVDEQRTYLIEKLAQIRQVKVFPSRVNFLLMKIIDEKNQPEKLYDHLLDNGIVIRRCANFNGLNSSFYRIAVLSRAENERLVEALKHYFKPTTLSMPIRDLKKKKTPALMILGTGSNVGKSLLVTAFCRIFLNEGLRVYPFKAQNMSLNSCVTLDGLEISRAQYLQAQAARVEPDVKMNPVLLKPVGKLTSQVVLLGKPIGNQGYVEYRENIDTISKTVCEAYDNLSANADLMVLEGAGSPVEMNLKSRDIVNMKMAEYAEAKVLLAGNIDFGGIYASLAGTLMLLDKKERQMVVGLIVNQFRGDEGLFKDGRTLLEKITGKPVVGVIPYVDKLLLPDEDSMAFSTRRNQADSASNDSKNYKKTTLNIYVIRLPHMSNFTDFDPFFQQPEIRLTFLESPPNRYKNENETVPDAVILPGSKNVMTDMNWLNETGLSKYITHLRENSKAEIIGLCGGFQMLGRLIKDPHSIESQQGEIAGLGLLDMTTELAVDKTLRRYTGTHMSSNIGVYGYEIHHGITEGSEKPVLTSDDIAGSSPGFSTADNRVWGTYIHGLFDEDDFRLWFFNRLLQSKNLAPIETIVRYDIDSAIENFASIVKNNLDMNFIRKAIWG